MSGEEKPQKGLIHFKNFLGAILDVQQRYLRELTITSEDSGGKEYASYHFAFDFGVDKFESFIVMYWDIDEFDEVKLIAELDEIVLKAGKIRGRE